MMSFPTSSILLLPYNSHPLQSLNIYELLTKYIKNYCSLVSFVYGGPFLCLGLDHSHHTMAL